MRYLAFTLLLVGLLGCGLPQQAWAQACTAPDLPECPDIDTAKGKLNATKDLCEYDKLCTDSDKPAGAGGICASVVLECPSGTTGTAPDDCQTIDRECPSSAPADPDTGECILPDGVTGTFECPEPGVLTPDADPQKPPRCLFDVGQATLPKICPQGYTKHSATQCVYYLPCADGSFGATCTYHPNDSAVCDYAERENPL